MGTTRVTEPVRLVESQIREAGNALARAFVDDPLCTYITPDAARRARTLPWPMSAFVRYYYPFGSVYTTAGPVKGVAIWAPPGHVRTTFGQMLRAGLLAGPFKVGFRDTLRFLSVINHLEKYHEVEVPPRHWYLTWLGVDPPSQGRGIGTVLLQPVLSQADHKGLPCYLQNSKAKNLTFYQRQGFEVVTEIDVPKGGPHIWTMRREPTLPKP